MALAESRKLKHSDDVYTDSGKLCLGCEPGSAIGLGRLEYMGHICGYRMSPRRSVGDGDWIRDQGEERKEER